MSNSCGRGQASRMKPSHDLFLRLRNLRVSLQRVMKEDDDGGEVKKGGQAEDSVGEVHRDGNNASRDNESRDLVRIAGQKHSGQGSVRSETSSKTMELEEKKEVMEKKKEVLEKKDEAVQVGKVNIERCEGVKLKFDVAEESKNSGRGRMERNRGRGRSWRGRSRGELRKGMFDVNEYFRESDKQQSEDYRKLNPRRMLHCSVCGMYDVNKESECPNYDMHHLVKKDKR